MSHCFPLSFGNGDFLYGASLGARGRRRSSQRPLAVVGPCFLRWDMSRAIYEGVGVGGG